jgi:hypothetical protein
VTPGALVVTRFFEFDTNLGVKAAAFAAAGVAVIMVGVEASTALGRRERRDDRPSLADRGGRRLPGRRTSRRSRCASAADARTGADVTLSTVPVDPYDVMSATT